MAPAAAKGCGRTRRPAPLSRRGCGPLGGGGVGPVLPPFRLGMGGRLGDGRQWVSWIHQADLAAMYQFAVENPVRGALNGFAPIPVTTAFFTQSLAGTIPRPAIFPVPEFGLKLLF